MLADKEGYQPLKTEPRFFYGYIVVIAAFFIMMVSRGVYNSFGVFFTPLLTEFGWARAVTSGAFSVSMIMDGVLSIVMGGLTDRFGPRVILTFCGFLLGLGFLLMSQVNALWQLYVFYGVVIGIGISGIWVPLLSTISKWFVKRRSLMTGVVVAGVGIGTLVAPPLISRLIATYDWRPSYMILGGIVLVVLILVAQLLKREPTQTGQLPYGVNEGEQRGLESGAKAFSLRDATHTSQFWVAFILFFCFGFCLFATMVHIVPHAIELEISAVSAANLLSIIGGISIFSSYALGSVGDRIGNRQVFIICFILVSAALFGLVLSRELWMLYLFAAVFGLAAGGEGAVESPLVAGLFGLSYHGLIYGVLHLGFNFGAAVGPFVMGYIFDVTGSYQMAFSVSAAFGIVGLILAAVLRPTKRLGIKI